MHGDPFRSYVIQRVPFETYAFQRAPSETIAGASLKPDAVVHRVNGLEEVRWTRNSRWPRHSHLSGSKRSCQWRGGGYG